MLLPTMQNMSIQRCSARVVVAIYLLMRNATSILFHLPPYVNNIRTTASRHDGKLLP